MMNVSKEQVKQDLAAMFSADQVVTQEEALREYDSENRNFAKANGIYAAPLPICILNVTNKDEVAKALQYCNTNGVAVIPRTGASSYEGLLTAISEDTIVLDASAMNKIIKIDYENMSATCECGVPLDTLEQLLQAKGFTTGHSPQSLPVAQMGGLVATRSIGQFSTYYGGIEDMLCGLEAVMPDGRLVRIRNVPRRSAGPDLRHLFMGSEGALGFITEVTVKIFTYYPNDFWKGGYIVPSMEAGISTIQRIMAAGYRPSVVRLYDKPDFDYNFGSVTLKDGQAYMFFVAEGPPAIAKATGDAIHAFALEAKGEYIGTEGVEHWLLHRNDHCTKRFKIPATRQQYREVPIFYATNEISASYTDIREIYKNVMANVPGKIDNLVLLGGHVSHAYQTGVNIYFVYRLKVEDATTYFAAHQAIIDAICEEVLKAETGGCVHHHGMGKQRVKFAPQEHGSSYFLMKELKKMMDPNGIMNPGVLITQ
ncbi:MAG: FAD-binding oxidoreductase [Planctomycetaceae bacterium]|nr:FAD-binding oxidoreductase [Planctomycetaceae bacterium]